MKRWSAAVALLALAGLSGGAQGGQTPRLPVTLPSGKVLQAEVVSTPEARGLGLMFRDALPRDEGMLFLFEEPGFHSFWMKNCKFAIDIVWMDDARRVVHLAERVRPCRKDPCPAYVPMRQASFVLEMSSGQARREGVQIGTLVDFQLPR